MNTCRTIHWCTCISHKHLWYAKDTKKKKNYMDGVRRHVGRGRNIWGYVLWIRIPDRVNDSNLFHKLVFGRLDYQMRSFLYHCSAMTTRSILMPGFQWTMSNIFLHWRRWQRLANFGVMRWPIILCGGTCIRHAIRTIVSWSARFNHPLSSFWATFQCLILRFVFLLDKTDND